MACGQPAGRPQLPPRAPAAREAGPMRAWLLVPAAVILTAAAAATPVAAPVAAPSGRLARPALVTYSAPVAGRVVRPFDPPATPYGPGHRGVDLAARAGSPVRAAADGLVTFAGPVAGRGVVVLAHADGITTEY